MQQREPPAAASSTSSSGAWVAAVSSAWATRPSLHWVATYGIVMSYFFFYRIHTVGYILDAFAASDQHTAGVKVGGMALGVLEDFIITTILVLLLLVIDLATGYACTLFSNKKNKTNKKQQTNGAGSLSSLLRVATPVARFLVAFTLVVLVFVIFAADLLLLRTRQMRFTVDYIAMYNREKAEASNLQVDKREIRLIKETIAATVVIALFFAFVYARWVDLTTWVCVSNRVSRGAVVDIHRHTDVYQASPAKAKESSSSQESQEDSNSNSQPMASTSTDKTATASEEPKRLSTEKADSHSAVAATVVKPHKSQTQKKWFRRRRVHVALALWVGFVVQILVTCAIAHAVSPATASLALNMTLNELFRSVFHMRFEPLVVVRKTESTTMFIHSDTEEYTLFKEDVLYRTTTGFKGPLAFDVHVDHQDPPNVIVIAVESMRYADSLYMSSESGATTGGPGAELKKHNLSVTPNLDRWAKRGIAFNNMWSSWQTSRSVESILYAQLPYDSPHMTGMTGGRTDTTLSGVPHLFQQKGYETLFTTGCTVKYDQWDTFLPAHGFDQVYGEPEIKAWGMSDLHLTKDEWDATHRSLNWGVHDDISFEVLGNLMINKTAQQQARVAKGEAKKPFFLTHYTISSHSPFDYRPDWYTKTNIPDFSPLCKGKENANVIKNYNELRYFTDVELGKFMDRMEAQGILNDTIVVITGDHGQSPEFGLSMPILDQVSVTHVPAVIVAEGRLGQYAGLMIHEPAEHYDILNTLADITGLPPGGFMQTGVGRSLKRKDASGNRTVWSNNPYKKKAAIKGAMRLTYDSVGEAVMLHDAKGDPGATIDLFPALPQQEQDEWLAIRDNGRHVNEYFKKRWDAKCLTQVKCPHS